MLVTRERSAQEVSCYQRDGCVDSASGVNNKDIRRKVMGEILEIASWVGTPIGAVCAVAFVVALYFFGRWVLTD